MDNKVYVSKKTITNEDIRKLVVARLRLLSNDGKISMGLEAAFSREELINHVNNDDKIGKKIVQIQLEYLQSLKEGIFLVD